MTFRLLPLALLCLAAHADAAAPAPAPKETVRFVALGDAGSGRVGQMAVAQAMSEVCATRGCDFAVMLGDNFYPDGVHSAHDRQFETKFEEPYEELDIPFFAVLGDHDNGEDGAHNRYGDYQVEYSRRQDRSSDKWHMPARYYQFNAPTNASRSLVEFFALDSTPVAPSADDPDPTWKAEAYAEKQLSWLQKALKASTAVWKIAIAHHPYVSGGGHGSAGRYLVRSPTSRHAGGKLWRDLVDKSICAAGVDLMLQAHDHDLQWLKPVAACGRTEFVTSGAGGAQVTALFSKDQAAFWQQGGRYGFFWFELDRTRLTGAAFALDEDAELPRDEDARPKPVFMRTLCRRGC